MVAFFQQKLTDICGICGISTQCAMRVHEGLSVVHEVRIGETLVEFFFLMDLVGGSVLKLAKK